jgi:hypothetical protein
MSISRRQFFRGVRGQGERREREQARRTLALDTHVRTNLLPYDFGLTSEQTDEVLATVRAAINIEDEDELFSQDRLQRIQQVVEATVGPWREEFWKAEEVRHGADDLVQEFFALEATPEDREKLCQRFHLPSPSVLEEEVARQVRAWLAGLPNSKMASCDGAALRELVFSELRSWC